MCETPSVWSSVARATGAGHKHGGRTRGREGSQPSEHRYGVEGVAAEDTGWGTALSQVLWAPQSLTWLFRPFLEPHVLKSAGC